eukprot:CAMPEP_0202876814 /NCGR_PEP_ID=MMETSP1391-20130828/29656_1 /ASSEMBLY_ACC=CAM_ASM_000867 /TAXON_ID=1034604 /ORGANISM="Chlamydomonas leiostraca, Strain SAG 11-49" /LENGTH=88 /DNA_ID=CAMNT_0049558737 /DNA_START=103 /DNA_END=366 /DNA_ORIENTATION=+
MEAFKLGPNAFLDSTGRGIAWPTLFQAVKAIVRANTVPDDVRSIIKGWWKDSSATVALMGLSVTHTISLNAGAIVRNQMAGAKWLERL